MSHARLFQRNCRTPQRLRRFVWEECGDDESGSEEGRRPSSDPLSSSPHSSQGQGCGEKKEHQGQGCGEKKEHQGQGCGEKKEHHWDEKSLA